MSETFALLEPHTKKRFTIGGVFGFLYLFVGVFLPFYNYTLFHDKGKHFPGFPYPIAATLLQLVGVVVVLSVYSFFKKLPSHNRAFGRLYVYRLSFIWPVCLSQAINIMLMNQGLFMLNVSLHVLLRASEIIWVVLLTFFFKKERPQKLVLFCCSIVFVGTLFIVYHIVLQKGVTQKSVWAVVIHFITTIISALNIVVFRVLILKLKNCSKHPIDAVELTILNISTMAILILPCALVFEPEFIPTLFQPNPKLWTMLGAGLVFTALYKLTFTALITQTTAVTVGVVSQLKVVVQVVLDVVLYKKYHSTVFMYLGAFFTCLGLVLYTKVKYDRFVREQNCLLESSIKVN
ncbi:hypothetical protein GEMRC1_010332 [Eukaryota sp. GEM-RC1]